MLIAGDSSRYCPAQRAAAGAHAAAAHRRAHDAAAVGLFLRLSGARTSRPAASTPVVVGFLELHE